MDAVRDGLPKMSEKEENVWADFLEHVFLGVLDNIYRHFSSPLSPEAAQSRYMDPDSVRIMVTRLGHMDEKLACNEPLMNVSVPRQWLGRGATAAAGYQYVVPIRKYQGGWKTPAGYTPYVPKNQAKYGHPPFVMPKNEVHDQVGNLQSGAPYIGQHMAERAPKAEIFRSQYPECYTREGNPEVHPMIAGMMHNYNKNISGLRISNM